MNEVVQVTEEIWDDCDHLHFRTPEAAFRAGQHDFLDGLPKGYSRHCECLQCVRRYESGWDYEEGKGQG